MDLSEKVSRYGIETSYIDGTGQTHTIDEQTFHRVLDALGEVPALAAPIIIRCTNGADMDELVTRLSHLHDWKIFDIGERLILSSVDAHSHAARLAFGTYRLRARGDELAEASLIVAPERAHEGAFDSRW